MCDRLNPKSSINVQNRIYQTIVNFEGSASTFTGFFILYPLRLNIVSTKQGETTSRLNATSFNVLTRIASQFFLSAIQGHGYDFKILYCSKHGRFSLYRIIKKMFVRIKQIMLMNQPSKNVNFHGYT